jgi:uncharacterized protein YkwD
MSAPSNTARAAGRAVRALAAGLVAVLAVAGLALVVAPAQAQTTSSRIMSMSPDSYESKVQHFINKRRAKHGLPKLGLESCTDRVAERWAQKLAATNDFYHQDMGKVLNTCRAYYAGETLGKGAISPNRLVYLWMHSPAHRHVLLSRHAKRIGVGSYVDASGAWVTAANFTKF